MPIPKRLLLNIKVLIKEKRKRFKMLVRKILGRNLYNGKFFIYKRGKTK